MKNSYPKIKLFFLAFILTTTQIIPCFAENSENIKKKNQETKISSITEEDINLKIKDDKQNKIKISEPVKEIKNQLFSSKEEVIKDYLHTQKKMDVADIQILWESTVDRNPVIKFALKKLALPAEQRRVHSSRLAKSVSALISGVSILPSLLGADSFTTSASSATGALANRLIMSKTFPKEMPLTDTELIQLARLIEELQDKIIRNYYECKSNLETYKATTKSLDDYNKIYSEAMKMGTLQDVIIAKALYYKTLNKENEFKQNVKINILELERLAGVNAIAKLKIDRTLSFEKQSSIQNLVNENKNFNSDIKIILQDINSELAEDKTEMLPDLNMLWGSAVERSQTIKFAIAKLSNPNGELSKPNTIKKILSPIASVAPIIGLGMSDPVTAGSAIISGGLLDSLLSDDSVINSKLSRVDDADLVLLAQETDLLQEKLVILYHNYLSSLIELKNTDQWVKESREDFDKTRKFAPETMCLADMYYKEALNNQFNARQNVLNTRVALEQFVGNDSLLAVDKNIRNKLGLNF